MTQNSDSFWSATAPYLHLLYCHLLQHHILVRPVIPPPRHLCDLIHDVLPLNHLAEDRMFASKPICRHDRDEELRSICIGPSVRHGELAGLVELVRRSFCLVFKLISGATHAGPLRISTLNHELRNYTMKNCSVIKTII